MENKLVVLGIPWDINTDGLRDYMSKFGDLDDCIVMKERSTGRSHGFGYVTFSLVEDAKEEMKTSSKKVTRIFVARILPSVTEQSFRSYFEKYGDITDLYMPKTVSCETISRVFSINIDIRPSVMGVDYQVSTSSLPATACIAAGCATTTVADETMGAQQSGNYLPCLWDSEFLQILDDHCTAAEKDLWLVEKLKEEVKSLITGFMEPLAKLEIIDTVQMLGLKYHFEKEINEALHAVHKDKNNGWWVDHLHATSLRFRLLRQSRIYVNPGKGMKEITLIT